MPMVDELELFSKKVKKKTKSNSSSKTNTSSRTQTRTRTRVSDTPKVNQMMVIMNMKILNESL